MGRVSTCQKNCKTIDLRGAQVNDGGFSFWFFEKKNCPKITNPIFRLILQNLAFPGSFPCILFYHDLLSLLSFGWFVIAVSSPILVRELVKLLV